MNLCTKLADQVQSGLIAAAMDKRSLILNHLKPEHNCFRVKRPMKSINHFTKKAKDTHISCRTSYVLVIY